VRLTLNALRGWSERSANRTIFVSAAVVASMTLVVKALALVKDLVVARAFGVGAEVDAFLVAFILPQFIINVVAGAFHTSLVPTYIEVRDRDGREAAQDLLSAVTARALAILAACTAALVIIGPLLLPVIGSGFDARTLDLSRGMFWLVLPAVMISGMGVIWGAVLNAGDRFALAAIAPAAVPAATLVLVLLMLETLGVQALALGLVAGFVLQAGLLAWSLRKRQYRLRPTWRTRQTASLSIVMGQFAPAVAAAVLGSGTELVDQAMATPLGEGSVSALNFGMKLLSFALAIAATGLSVTMLTHFSKLVAARDWAAIRHTYRRYALLIVAASVPLVVLIVVFSEPIVRLLYERGAFTPQDTLLVSRIQAAYALQIPFYLLGTITARLISAYRMQTAFFWLAGINFAVNVAFNLLFSRWFGVAGIALSTSLVSLASFAVMFALVYRRMARPEGMSSSDQLH
jgi:putative peptidoglycan lipid II flippase